MLGRLKLVVLVLAVVIEVVRLLAMAWLGIFRFEIAYVTHWLNCIA